MILLARIIRTFVSRAVQFSFTDGSIPRAGARRRTRGKQAFHEEAAAERETYQTANRASFSQRNQRTEVAAGIRLQGYAA